MSRVSRFLPALLLLGAWPAAHACDANGQTVLAVMGDKVATYDDQGEYVDEIPKSVVRLGTPPRGLSRIPGAHQGESRGRARGVGGSAGCESGRCQEHATA